MEKRAGARHDEIDHMHTCVPYTMGLGDKAGFHNVARETILRGT